MKKFNLYESFGSIDDDILERSEKRAKKRTPGKLTGWGALAACACLAVVTALYAQAFFAPDTRNNVEGLTGKPVDEVGSDVAAPDDGAASGYDALGYDAPGRDGEPVNSALGTPDAASVIGTPGTPDAVSVPVTPPAINESAPGVGTVPDKGSVTYDGEPLVSVEDMKKKEEADIAGCLRDNRETLTLQEGLETEILGAYLLAEAPRGFRLESIRRTLDGQSLYGVWIKSGAYDEIDWKVSLYSETDAGRVTAAADTRNYDMSLYPIPLCESVPEELRQIVDHPIFSGDELTQDVVNRRACYVNDSGDTAGARMTFGVLYGEVLVEVTTKGVSPEWLYERLSGLKSDTP